MDPKEPKAGTRDGPEEQHPNAESMSKTADDNSGGVISNDRTQQVERVEEDAGRKMSDIKALMAAKHAIPSSDQSDPKKMGEHYDRMAAKCKQHGLNKEAMKDSKKWFNTEGKLVVPKDYMNFDVPLAAGAVRLAVLRLTDSDSDKLATAVGAATDFILNELPEGSKFHRNEPEHYHVTVQMISHPSDPRPDAFRTGGGLSHSLDHHWIPAPLPSNLQKERDICLSCASEFPTPTLQGHSLCLADSGAILLLFTEAHGTIQALRGKLASELPGANEKQPTILHVTLARILEAELSFDQVAHITSICDQATERLRGQTFTPSALWHVIEKTFTFVNDDQNCVKCPFKAS